MVQPSVTSCGGAEDGQGARPAQGRDQHSHDGAGSHAGSGDSDDGLEVAVAPLDGLQSDSSSDSDSDTAGEGRSKSKSLFQRLTGAAAQDNAAEQLELLDEEDEDEDFESAGQNEDLEEDAMDSLLTAMEDARSGALERGPSGNFGGRGRVATSVRNAAKSVFGFLADDVRSARQTVVSVAGGLGGLAQGVGRAANTSRASVAAGVIM